MDTFVSIFRLRFIDVNVVNIGCIPPEKYESPIDTYLEGVEKCVNKIMNVLKVLYPSDSLLHL